MDTKLKGKNVLVTGASGGIGSSTAQLFSEEGANVVVHYHRNDKSATRQELPTTADPMKQCNDDAIFRCFG